MGTYIMIGKYSADSIKDISANRTDKTLNLISEVGGKLISMYALLGGNDFVIIAELPDTKTAMKVSMGLTLLSGIGFSTYPAIGVDDFDRMIGT